MLLEMKVPSPGESISEVEIADWLVEDGDYVEKDQSIAEIDSDKATLELPAEQSGVIKIIIESGSTVAVGDVVCVIDTSVKDNPKKCVIKNSEKDKSISQEKVKKQINKSDSKEIKTTPLAKSIIQENDLSTKSISSSSDKIRKSDVLKKIEEVRIDGPRGRVKKKMSALRRKIASRLVTVKNETAMLTTFNEVDMSGIFEVRKKYKEAFKEKHNVSLGFMSFFTKAVTTALMEFEDVNAMIDGTDILHYNYSDIGIAVSAPKGLMVPILRNAELMSFLQVEREIKRLAIKAREGDITIEEMTGGTFTITNGGVFGSMLSTPIINPPQSAILGMHNIVDRPVVIDGKVEVRPIMYVALSYDHRVIDGKESVGFLCRIKECLEDPVTHLMDGNVLAKLDLH